MAHETRVVVTFDHKTLRALQGFTDQIRKSIGQIKVLETSNVYNIEAPAERPKIDFELGDLPLVNAVYQALGAASMTWTPAPNGVYDTEMATQIADQLLLRIQKEIDAGGNIHGVDVTPPQREE